MSTTYSFLMEKLMFYISRSKISFRKKRYNGESMMTFYRGALIKVRPVTKSKLTLSLF
jgi:hypothetical protein